MMRSNHGFSLIEVLVALGLVAILSWSVLGGFITQTRLNTFSEVRSQAAVAAQEVFDSYRLLDPATLPESGTAATTSTIDGRVYSVTTEFCANAALCSSERVRHLTVTVQYQGQITYQAETVYVQLK